MMIEKMRLKSDRALSLQQLACCGSHCCMPVHGKDLMVYDHLDRQKEPLLLTGHHRDVSAMTFGHGNILLLCSASADYIVVWDIELCKQKVQQGKVADGIIIGKLLGEVVHLSFCYADERVAVCSGATIYILSSKQQQVILTLTGYLGALTSAEFCPWDPDILVSTSEDRMFRVWDLQNEDVLYQSFVLSAFPLSTALFLEDRHLITGSVDGQMWCFSLNDCYQCHLVMTMDLQMMEKRHQRTVNQQGGVNQTESDEVVSKPVLRMASWSQIPDLSADKKSWFCIGSSDGLYVVDVATSELQTVLYFKDHPDLSVSRAGSWVISLRHDKMFFLVSSLFSPIVALLELRVCDDLGRMWTSAEGLSVFPSSPPLLQSPLNAELKKKESNLPKKKGGIKEQPLVFNSKVKSSGYSSAPRKVLFSPKTNVQKNPPTKKSPKKFDLIHKDYPADSAAPTVLCVDRHITDKKVSCLQYSG
uniref:WD repeat-containing protein 27 n=1 Tax=Gouania willdenowi TaxID=441366 RepID=A0A8C5EI94_GOUWI